MYSLGDKKVTREEVDKYAKYSKNIHYGSCLPEIQK